MTDDKKISVISLGGRGEVGKNMIVVENEEDMIVLDTGTLFPDDEKYGVDLIIPDISYLEKNQKKLRGIIFSHGHEDHIGAIPYLLEKITPPLYGTDLTIGLIKDRLENNGLIDKANLNTIGSNIINKDLELGSFKIEFCHVNHSIPASVAMGIHTPAGLIIYTGDYKFDQTPINNPQTDYDKLANWGRQGVLALLGDSTNAEHEGHTLSERVVARSLEESFSLVESRIIIATFSSNIDRIQQILKAAKKNNRKIAISGRSMANTIEIASKLAYLDIPEGMIISINEANKMKPEEIVLLMTGSQGEYRAALSRLARNEHREISIIPGDTVYLSSSPIPGNEKAIGETINMLYSKGAKVIYNGMIDLHASGHACQEEIKLMINLTKPKYLIPVHGEFRHLYHHAQLARQVGIPVGNIIIALNGDRVEISPDKAAVTEKVAVGELYIEGYQISKTDELVLTERRKLSENGFINIILAVDQKLNLYSRPLLISRGFIYKNELQAVLNDAEEVVVKALQTLKSVKNKSSDPSLLKNRINSILGKYFYEKTNRSPLIITELLIIKNTDN
ncbi:RNase J family beta-CASP ribonuclease [Iocasia frigidifontis]|uniref:Ribonuclease J n=1 Tax=Iocasia fonsfrigidae TaxID=2682810 RepID=A0A8A7K5W2_9FIRM|nr:ribonuclease J [Iocasia fonsfrigidae]QTL97096.1 RNase J family beta-CASP ribonuclease [Iocasia fonsfrigidae]